MLQIHPGASFSEPITCSLFTWSIDSLPAPFEALSYTWGNTQERYWISIDGLAFQVAPNLLGALQQFRLKDEPRFLWVDAICINQEDLTERGSQVQFMDLIYQRAARVLVWLGVLYNNSDLAFGLLETVKRVMNEEHSQLLSGQELRQYSAKKDILARGLPPPSDPAWLALDGIFWRPWFLRVWVVQEVCVSRNAVIFCGANSIDFDVFCDVAFYMHSTVLAALTAVSVDRVLSLQTARIRYQNDNRANLIMQLISSRNCLATNPVDKVFALLNISKERPEDRRICPDYHRSAADVFSEVARLLLAENIDVLNLNCDPIWRSERNLPSWAPDWSSVPREFCLLFMRQGEWFHAGQLVNTFSAPAVRFSANGRILFIKGRIIDKVDRLGESHFAFTSVRYGKVHDSWYTRYMDQNNQLADFSQSRRWMMWERLALRLKTYPATGENILTAYQKTIIAEAKFPTQATSIGTLSPSLDDLYRAFRRVQSLFATADPESSSEEARRVRKDRHDVFYREVHKASYGRKLFTTCQGYMGIGPVSTWLGYYVAVLEGARTPFLLKKKKNGCYALIGEAYVHGLMRGEGIMNGKPLEELAIE